MFYLYILAGLSVTIIALFRRELLIQSGSFKLILTYCVALFIAGVVLQFGEVARSNPSGAFLAPLICLAFFRFLRWVFLRRAHREPRDTYLDWSRGLGPDRIFNIIYFTGSAWIVLATMILMTFLANASR